MLRQELLVFFNETATTEIYTGWSLLLLLLLLTPVG
eukprot:COSAG04_NODE_22138_length_360_cov_1.386973_1_plen_35_part_01